MMESSEHYTCDSTQDPNDPAPEADAIAVVANYEDSAEENQNDEVQVSEHSILIDEANTVMLLQSPEIEIDGKRYALSSQTADGEIILYVINEQDTACEELISENSDADPTLALNSESNNSELIPGEDSSEISEENVQGVHKVVQQCAIAYVDSDRNHSSSDNLSDLTYQVDGNTSEMIFIPTTSKIIPVSVTDETKHKKLLQLADVAHEQQLAEKESVHELECSRDITEESVIVNQTHPGSDTTSLSNSSEIANVTINLVNEQDIKDDLSQEHVKYVVEMPTVKVSSPSLPSTPPRAIDNTVSVIHSSSTYTHDQNLKNGSEVNGAVDECRIKHNVDKNRVDKVNYLEEISPATLTNANYIECSNVKEILDTKLSNQTENSLASSNCAKLIKESNSNNLPSVGEQSLAVEPKSIVDGSNTDEHTNPEAYVKLAYVSELQLQQLLSNQTENSLTSSNCIKLIKESNSKNLPSVGDESSAVEPKRILDGSSLDEHASSEMHVQAEGMDDDTNDPVDFSCRSSSIENVNEDELKGGSSDNSNDVKSTSMEVDTYASLDNETVDPDSMNSASEIAVPASTEACSEIPVHSEPSCLPINDNSNSKNSVFSNTSQPSQSSSVQNLSKMNNDLKPLNQSKIKDPIDEYEFENSSSNLDREISHHSSPQNQTSDMSHNSDDISTEVDVTKISQSPHSDSKTASTNLTFQGALTPAVDKEVNDKHVDDSTTEPFYNHSDDLFEGTSEKEENNSCELSKSKDVESCTNHQNSAISEIGQTNEMNKSIEANSTMEKNSGVFCPNEENGTVSSMMISEETVVRPPKKTYVRKRKLNPPIDNKSNQGTMELFSLDDFSSSKDGDSLFCDESSKEKEQIVNPTVESEHNDEGDELMNPNVKNRISSTYKIKKISSAVSFVGKKKRTFHLRSRSSDQNDKNSNSKDTEDPESAHWGAYLMGKSFKPIDTEDTPNSSSADVQIESETLLPSPLKKRCRPSSYQNSSTLRKAAEERKEAEERSRNSLKINESQWAKFIKMSPTKTKHTTSDERKIRKKVKKRVATLCKSQSVTNNYPTPNMSLCPRKRGRPHATKRKSVTFLPSIPGEVKRSGIKILNDSNLNEDDPEEGPSMPPEEEPMEFQFACSNACCSFVTNKVNNLILHLKYCSHKPSNDTIEYRVDDMDRRQRIRGEGIGESDLEKSSSSRSFANGSAVNMLDDNEGEYSSPSQEEFSQYSANEETDMLSDEEKDHKTKYGFVEKEVVWAKVNSRFWPALVLKIDDTEVLGYLIDHPTCKGVRLRSIYAVSDLLHSYDDVKWNKKLLEEAANLPSKDDFVRAVQKSDSFLKKKFLYDYNIDEIDFFKIPDKVEYTDIYCDDDSSIIEEFLDDKIDRRKDEEVADVQEVLEVIFEGQCDEYVLSIYHKKLFSERHEMHFAEDEDTSNKLKNMSWFGPFKTECTMQIRLYDYFSELYRSKLGESENMISYIYEVWIPEAIIKAIAIVKKIDLVDAEIIFYKQDTSNLTVGDFEAVDSDDS